jgi:hypothetical protein
MSLNLSVLEQIEQLKSMENGNGKYFDIKWLMNNLFINHNSIRANKIEKNNRKIRR